MKTKSHSKSSSRETHPAYPGLKPNFHPLKGGCETRITCPRVSYFFFINTAYLASHTSEHCRSCGKNPWVFSLCFCMLKANNWGCKRPRDKAILHTISNLVITSEGRYTYGCTMVSHFTCTQSKGIFSPLSKTQMMEVICYQLESNLKGKML